MAAARCPTFSPIVEPPARRRFAAAAVCDGRLVDRNAIPPLVTCRQESAERRGQVSSRNARAGLRPILLVDFATPVIRHSRQSPLNACLRSRTDLRTAPASGRGREIGGQGKRSLDPLPTPVHAARQATRPPRRRAPECVDIRRSHCPTDEFRPHRYLRESRTAELATSAPDPSPMS
jgi:hypothetical protein